MTESSDHNGRATSIARERRGRGTAAGMILLLTILILLALLVFVAQNSRNVEIHYLGAHTSLSVGVALILGAVGGAVITVLASVALRLRRTFRAHS